MGHYPIVVSVACDMWSPCLQHKLCLPSCLLLLCLLSALSTSVQPGNQNVLASINGHGQLGVSAVREDEHIVHNATAQKIVKAAEPAGDPIIDKSHDCLQNVIQRDSRNIGQGTSGPLLYARRLGFKGCLAESPVDLFADEAAFGSIGNNSTIFGGGGLFSSKYESPSQHFFAKAKGPIVVWGVGLSDTIKDAPDWPKLPDYLRGSDANNQTNLKLIGLRDYFHEDRPMLNSSDILAPLLRWVPCASAMNPAFDRYLVGSELADVPVKRHIGYVRPSDFDARRGCEGSGLYGEHPGFSGWLAQGLMTSTDMAPDYLMIDDMLKFLAETNVVVTNSYQAIYWATLLGKKVILCNRWSTEFDHLKWPATEYTGNLGLDAQIAVPHPGAMQEARDANQAFAEEVREKLGLEGSIDSQSSASGLLRPADASSDGERPIQSSRMFMILAVAVALIITGFFTVDHVRKRVAARERRMSRDSLGIDRNQLPPVSPDRQFHGVRAPPAAPPSLQTPQLGRPGAAPTSEKRDIPAIYQ